MSDLRRETLVTSQLTFSILTGGQSGNAAIFFLHGFPEFSFGWRHQLAFFIEQGYRVIAPDQRGYNLSDCPRQLSSYTVDQLAEDLLTMTDALGMDKIYLVAHDWGGGVAWRFAQLYPEKIERMVVINMPLLAVMKRALRQNPAQMLKSWYIFFFQLPWLPEMILRLGNFAALRRVLQKSSKPGTFTDQEMEKYCDAWRRPGRLTAMINWYRAIVRKKVRKLPTPRVDARVLIIWGEEDRFLGREMAEPSAGLCRDGKVIFVPDATHWIHLEQPDLVNTTILNFFAED